MIKHVVPVVGCNVNLLQAVLRFGKETSIAPVLFNFIQTNRIPVSDQFGRQSLTDPK